MEQLWAPWRLAYVTAHQPPTADDDTAHPFAVPAALKKGQEQGGKQG